ncbi:MAG: dehydrogenase E1 component subunit alpha/beta [Spirochaetota bacterium]|nr:MAG: dehydrogenase E1 component subunit alpha/beta [Spirochaetota bacterium]
MKVIDVKPCKHEVVRIKFPEITINRYNPRLKDELDKGLVTEEVVLMIYRAMLYQRAFEFTVRDLENKSLVPHDGYEFRGSTHLSYGQEAAQVGAMSALNKEDYITAHHRAHGHCIAKGYFAYHEMDDNELKKVLSTASENQFSTDKYGTALEAVIDYHLYRMMAEILGKQAGYCKGRGGGMHVADFSVGNLGANAIVGGGLGIATGAALTVMKQQENRIVLCAIGDGAMNNGIAHESMNFAAMAQFEKGLPIIFYVENNQYGYSGQQKGEVTGIQYLSQRGAGYNDVAMHAETVCGMNILSVRDAIQRAKELCIQGKGPVLIEANTYRFWGHNFKDKGTLYRTEEEKKAWREHDPVEWFKGEIADCGILTAEEAEAEWESAYQKLHELTVLAAKSKDPDIKDIMFGVFSDTNTNDIGDKYKTVNLLKKPRKFPRDSEGRILARHAVLEALTEEMIRDKRVVLWGEDIAEQGGAYQATLGLLDIFGRERIFNTAISESAIIGTGVGASMVGLRPVVELMYIDFVLQAMDQVGNQAAKARFMFGGQSSVPLTIRATVGGGKGYAGQHAQSLEAIITHFPGLKVVMPSNAYDMKGLLKTAIRDDNPVFFIEHQWVYLEKAVVPADEEYTIPFGQARIARKGKDITVVALSNMVSRTLEAAEILEKEDGVQVEVIDPRTLVPLDVDTLGKSVNKTGRAAIVLQAFYTGSYASHISHEITRVSFKSMKCPVRIISSYDITPPMAHPLEDENVPNPARIVKSIRETLKD